MLDEYAEEQRIQQLKAGATAQVPTRTQAEPPP